MELLAISTKLVVEASSRMTKVIELMDFLRILVTVMPYMLKCGMCLKAFMWLKGVDLIKLSFRLITLEVIKLIFSSKLNNKSGPSMVHKIQGNLKNLYDFRIKHILNEANKCADHLVKFSLFMTSNNCNFVNCLPFLHRLVQCS